MAELDLTQELPRIPTWTAWRAFLVHQDTAHELGFDLRDNARLLTVADLLAFLAALPAEVQVQVITRALCSLNADRMPQPWPLCLAGLAVTACRVSAQLAQVAMAQSEARVHELEAEVAIQKKNAGYWERRARNGSDG